MKNIIIILSVITLFFCNFVQGIEYNYDSIGRLTKVTYENATSITYTYDDAGNLTDSITNFGVEFSPDVLLFPRESIYQGNEGTIDLFALADGATYDGTPTIFNIDISTHTGFVLDEDYVNNGLLYYTPPAGFSGVITITYQILENGVVTTIERHIVVREFDSDGDGLPDEWEEAGSVNGVSLAGAEVGKKDIFLWIDHMYQDCALYQLCEDVDYKLNDQLKSIQAAFARQNINLHIKHGTAKHRVSYLEDVPLGVEGVDCSSTEGHTALRCGLASAKEQGFWLINGQDDIDKSREKVYHYMLIGDGYGGGSSTGIVFREPNIIFVARGKTANDTSLTGTIMHEFGHALGLGHGGPINGDYGVDEVVTLEDGTEIKNYNIHYKPNYLSVMNYHFQQSGLRTLNSDGEFEYGLIDFATSSLSTIDETNLPSSIECLSPELSCVDEGALSNFGSKFIRNTDDTEILPELCVRYGWDRCPASLDDFTIIDWQANGETSADINWRKKGDTAREKAAYGKGLTRLVSQADWSNLDFTLGYIGDPDEALTLNAGASISDKNIIIEPPVEEITFPMEYRVELSAVRQLSIFKPGDSRSALGYRLANTGTQSDDYTISYHVEINDGSGVPASAWQVSGPTSVHLAPDNEIYLNIEVTAPVDVVDGDEAEIVITVNSSGNSTIKAQQFGIIRITEAVFDDSDSDGIPDSVELELGTDPNNADADGDGLLDSQDPEPNTPNSVESAPQEPSWVEITDQVTVNQTIGVFNRAIRKITSIVTLENTSGAELVGDIRVELVSSNLAINTASDGELENGNHFWDLTNDSGVFPVNTEVSKQLNFALSRARLSYEVKVHLKEK